ncbi:hypothetical protein QZM22_12280 [Burkholderia oklahomensis]|uniref:hypothetical protein n=1 Tax=Burkholderia oklahomensis TaxID=342113 RepID=UPI00264B13EB|nr:hypothetical protein [Burkholderia oklahomensis]MDN7673277.1 hypothetical protein [Burkholderia oklahomensis]
MFSLEILLIRQRRSGTFCFDEMRFPLLLRAYIRDLLLFMENILVDDKNELNNKRQ